VDDLQGMVSELQQAQRKNRLKNVSSLEEQMHQMLREWKAELHEASLAFYCW
jgi:flagellin-specific chaperone FliS